MNYLENFVIEITFFFEQTFFIQKWTEWKLGCRSASDPIITQGKGLDAMKCRESLCNLWDSLFFTQCFFYQLSHSIHVQKKKNWSLNAINGQIQVQIIRRYQFSGAEV